MALDWTAFTAPVTPQQVQQWKAAAQAANHRWAGDVTARVVVALVFLIPAVVLFVGIGVALLLAAISGFVSGGLGGVTTGVFGILVGLFCLAVVALAVWGMVKVFPSERRWERWLRLDWFARANRMTFSPSDPNPNYPGAIFKWGGGRASIDHFRSVDGRFFDLGNFQYVVSNGKSSTTHTWGFLALNLERRLPHMLLDSVQNNSWGSPGLAGLFDRDQVLSLEGDFDRWFTLYCPQEYERDALYVFTPDLMALCIDQASPFDVEIVDDWMFVYSPRAFRMDDPQLLGRLFGIIETVGAKALRQTDRYRDERVDAPFPANVVAPAGQRLQPRLSIVAVVAIIIVVALPLVLGAFAVFGGLLYSVSGG
jgi:hypothetical protein